MWSAALSVYADMNRRLILTLLLPLAAWGCLTARDEREQTGKYTYSVGADVRGAWVLPTGSWFRGLNPQDKRIGAAMTGTIKGAFSPAAGTDWHRQYSDTYQGLGVSYTDFFNRSLMGRPVSVYVFQGFPFARPTPKLGLYAEWEFGASFGWHTQRGVIDQGVNGSATTARLAMNLAARYRLSEDVELVAAFDLTHYSNGNTRYPNAGTNLAGLRIGLSYRPGNHDSRIPSTPFLAPSVGTQQTGWTYDLLIYGAAHKRFYHDEEDTAIPLPGCFGVAGVTFGPMREFKGGVLRAGGTVDLQWDEGADLERYEEDVWTGSHPVYRHPPVWRQMGLGVSVRGEIVLPLFAINVGIGRNIYAAAPDQRVFYQTLALKTMITRRAYLNVGYSLRNFAHPRNLMIGLGWRFGSPSPAPALADL